MGSRLSMGAGVEITAKYARAHARASKKDKGRLLDEFVPPVVSGIVAPMLRTPTLYTERLRLRPFDDGDADDLFALQSNAHVLRY